jgi:hypothetical protein
MLAVAYGDRAAALADPGCPGTDPVRSERGGVMAKRLGRPSLQYRYEHYDPR